MTTGVADLETRALALVEECLDHADLEHRAHFIQTRCAGDAVLLARVNRILGMENTQFKLLATESLAKPVPVAETLPDRIGPFRVTGVLGRGGMGSVVRAERDDGVFAQTVAIKLIRGDLQDARTRAHFTQERRILARLDHPGIGRILDGGNHAGRPYLVMEFVDGVPVTEALARRGADLATRIAAFVAIAEAVAHAHRNLVVHADIKPSNVIMTADGTIKLLDFGIARLTIDLDVDEMVAPYPLTRAYAAPERLAGAGPTIAGDVYSLGVLLHELLTGSLPVAGRKASETEALAPTERAKLRGDLDAIVARALAPDSGQRYSDVSALLSDIAAWRDHFVVAARSDRGWRYVASKFFRRHRSGVLLTAFAMTGLMIAAVVSTSLYVSAERARREADRRFFEVRDLARFMLFDLYDQLADAPGTVASRVQLADTARRYLDRLRAVPGTPLDLRLDIAKGYRRLATVEGLSGVASLGRTDAAKRSLVNAEVVLRNILAEAPADAAASEELGWVYASLWTLLADNADSPGMTAAAERAFAAALRADPRRDGARLGLINMAKNRGYDLIWADKSIEALPILKRALMQLRATRFTGHNAQEAVATEIAILNRIGDATYYSGNITGALAPYREAEAIVRRELAVRETPRWLDRLGEAKFNISGTLADMNGHSVEALAEARAGVTAMERVLSFGQDANAEKRLVMLYGQESLVLSMLGRLREAVAVSGRGIAIRERRLAGNLSDPQRNRDLAVALPNHARLLTMVGRRAEACAAARKAVSLWTIIEQRRHLSAHDARNDVVKSRAAATEICG